MLLIQIFILAFVAFALWRTIARFRVGELKLSALVLWFLFWFALAVAALLPQSTSRFASLVGVGRGVDAAIYLAIIALFYLVFRIFLRIERIEHDITLVVREMGLRESGEAGKRGSGEAGEFGSGEAGKRGSLEAGKEVSSPLPR